MTYYVCQTFDASFYDRAPERFVFIQDLDCTPAKLFTIFEDPESWSKWAYGLGKVTWTSPKPYGVGTTRTVELRGGPLVYEEFIAWEPGKTMAFCFHGATEAVWWSFGERYEVTDLGGGRSRLRWTVAYDPRGYFASLHPYIRPMMNATLKSFMVLLARYVKSA